MANDDDDEDDEDDDDEGQLMGGDGDDEVKAGTKHRGTHIYNKTTGYNHFFCCSG